MKLIYLLITLALGAGGLYWYSDRQPDLKNKAEQLLSMRAARGFEIHYQIEQIVELQQKRLLKEKGARIIESSLKFYPYLLIEAKYASKKKSRESLLIWDLTDGEMVLDATSWEKTHGFGDCIRSHTLPHEFKIISALARKGGNCERVHLIEKLGEDYPHLDTPLFEAWVRGCFKKNLLIEVGDRYRLHLQNPKLTRVPETRAPDKLITKMYKQASRVVRHFSKAQVEKMASTAFGPHFSIRKSTEVYLPVYSIVVQLPSGALKTSHFNAFNGQPLTTALLYE